MEQLCKVLLVAAMCYFSPCAVDWHDLVSLEELCETDEQSE
jgi:hypothetical protein